VVADRGIISAKTAAELEDRRLLYILCVPSVTASWCESFVKPAGDAATITRRAAGG
jgi:hypothetical protein